MSIRSRVIALAASLVIAFVVLAGYFAVTLVRARQEMDRADRSIRAILSGSKARVAMSRQLKEFYDTLASGEVNEWDEMEDFGAETRALLNAWEAELDPLLMADNAEAVSALRARYETNLQRFGELIDAGEVGGAFAGLDEISPPVDQSMLDAIDEVLLNEVHDMKAVYRRTLRASGAIPWTSGSVEELAELTDVTLEAFLAADGVRTSVLRQVQDVMDLSMGNEIASQQRLRVHRAMGALAIDTWEHAVSEKHVENRSETGWEPRTPRRVRARYGELQTAVDEVLEKLAWARAGVSAGRSTTEGDGVPPAKAEARSAESEEEEDNELFERIEEELEDFADAALLPVIELSVGAYEEQLRQLHADIRRVLLRGGIAGLGVVLALAAVIVFFSLLSVRRIVAGLNQLRAGTVRIAEGDWDHKIALQGSDEFSVLSQSFDRMVDQISHTTTSVKRLEREVEERKRTETALESARQVAERAAEAKTQFLANMSHEIRTPMNGVIGMTGLLLNTETTDLQREYLMTIQRSADSLLAVINDVLDFSKIDAGKLELDIVDFNLRRQLESINDTLAWRAQEKGLEYTCLIEEGVPENLRGDPGRLQQVLTNLVSNAVKFTHHGDISVRVKLLEELEDRYRVEFNIVDTGIGIDEEQIEELFDAFTQADTSTTREYGGTGLGLSISKRLVQLMEGEIGAEKNEGEGSRFWFTVLLEEQPGSPAIPAQPEREALATITDAYILIVDDNATNRLVLRRQLESWNFRYDIASGSQMALHKLREAHARGKPFTLAILDMQMPYMDGEALGHAIKDDPMLASTILIMMTSIGWRRESERMQEAGFASYLTKPVKQSQLFDCMASALGVTPPSRPSGRHDPLAVEHRLTLEQRRATRVLLVEDNSTNQIVALSVLKNWGFHTDAVSDGSHAVEALANLEYDVVLMDVQMPGMDGFEATKQIRSPESPCLNHRIPIVAMTAHALQGDREKCLAQGMDDYVSKPIKVQELLRAIEDQILEPLQRSVIANERPGLPAVPGGDPGSTPRDDDAAQLGDLFDKVGEDPELVAMIAETFRNDASQRLHDLRLACDSGNTDSLASISHAMKSAAGNVGAQRASEICQFIEERAAGGTVVGLSEKVDELHAAIASFNAVVDEWVSSRHS